MSMNAGTKSLARSSFGLRGSNLIAQSWRESAKCIGTDAKHWDAPTRLAYEDEFNWQVNICKNCPVAKQCAGDAWLHREHGVIRAGVPLPGTKSLAKKYEAALVHIATFGDIDGGRDLMPEQPRPALDTPPPKNQAPCPDKAPAL